jgi:methylenetetrahydrofolate dehydrogenase (NADP+)/methenyltetrahydrofolate cyclohydrolase
MTHIINGKDVAKQLRETLKRDVDALVAEKSITPGLAVILVGDDPASQVYVNSKIKACAATGIHSIERRLPENCERDYLLKTIHDLNADPLVHGILLQLPLPSHLDATEMISHIAPEKDVDGLHPINAGRLMAGLDCLTPCTPQGSLLLINEVEKDLSGMHAVIIGRSLLFGKPMGQILLNENCTVTQCHSRTKNIAPHCKNAHI